ncbi:unnamed protein product [Ceutorhynchus assimilis]|uniref:Uncharacterized protein n=1 Tax=Ceutorhynchus assimilis TaxID=467358 RepID=A0A9N9QPY9_9CUCU|nr:unnamed protein product [Ceutorhynchus assimilis]
MDNHKDLVKWFREMGYNGQIPDNLFAICNNSTKSIWKQLMKNVHPKQEIETIRRNIILNRLIAKSLNKQNEFANKIEQVEQFKRKMSSEKKLKTMEDVVQEKKHEVEQLSQNCRIKNMSLDVLKKKVEENKQRKYLLDSKKKLLEGQSLQAKETIHGLKNITPVDKEASCSTAEITVTLEKCVEKLNKHIIDTQKLHINSSVFIPSAQKKNPAASETSIATYLSIIEKQNFAQIERSCKKQVVQLKLPASHPKVKHRLFDTPKIIVNEEGSSDSGIKAFSIEEQDELSPITVIQNPKKNKRESLGLLPDSCLEDVANNENFLNVSAFSFKVPQTTKKVKKPTETMESELLYQKKAVNCELKKLLHSNDSELIYEVLQKSIQNVVVQFTKIVSMKQVEEDSQCKLNEVDLAKLRFIHVQTEFNIIEQKKAMQGLLEKISRRKLDILKSINPKENYLKERLELSIRQVGLQTCHSALKREIDLINIVENDDNNIKILYARISKIKTEIANIIHLLQLTMDELYRCQKSIVETSDLILNPLWQLRSFKSDTDWLNPLTEPIWTSEMKVFDKFPLEYQRRCAYTEPKIFYRNLCTDNYQASNLLSEKDLQMLSIVLDSPFNPPEAILLNFLRAQIKCKVLMSIRQKGGVVHYKKNYSLEDLQQQESYLQYALEQLRKLMFSTRAERTLSMGSFIKQAMDIWCEMPMKDFISESRVFQGNNFQFYQNKLKALI